MANYTNQSLKKHIQQACEIFEDLSEGSGVHNIWRSNQDVKLNKEKSLVTNNQTNMLNKKKFEKLYKLEYKLKQKIGVLTKNKSSKSLVKDVEIAFDKLKT